MAARGLIPHDHLHVEQSDVQDRFNLYDGEEFIGFLGYHRHGTVLDLQHTIIKQERSRKGYARALVTMVLERAWGRGESIIATCTYVADYLQRYPQYQRLVSNDVELGEN